MPPGVRFLSLVAVARPGLHVPHRGDGRLVSLLSYAAVAPSISEVEVGEIGLAAVLVETHGAVERLSSTNA
jgi:hypothetical protein